MSAPASQGRLCTTLKEMEIGDYIRCSYTASTANVAGYFTDLGSAVPGVTELPTTAAATANGYFYFLKVDKGLLVADRMVQSSISAQSLNAKNYLNGGDVDGKIIRCLSQTEWTKYLTNGNLNGCITKQDVTVWHPYYSNTFMVCKSGRIHYIEVIGKKVDRSLNVAMNINGKSYNTLYHIVAWYSNDRNPVLYLPKLIDFKTNIYTLTSMHCTATEKAYISFRPALEYIDNAKSKTNWY